MLGTDFSFGFSGSAGKNGGCRRRSCQSLVLCLGLLFGDSAAINNSCSEQFGAVKTTSSSVGFGDDRCDWRGGGKGLAVGLQLGLCLGIGHLDGHIYRHSVVRSSSCSLCDLVSSYTGNRCSVNKGGRGHDGREANRLSSLGQALCLCDRDQGSRDCGSAFVYEFGLCGG